MVLKTSDTRRVNARLRWSSTPVAVAAVYDRRFIGFGARRAPLQFPFDRDWQQMIDHVGAAVGIVVQRLCSPIRISRPRDQGGLPGCRRRFPIKFPQPPGARFRFANYLRALPRRSAIGTELDFRDLAISRPSRAFNSHVRTCCYVVAFLWSRDLGFDLQVGERR